MTAPAGDPPDPPDAATLLALDADAWATVVAAARGALAALDDADRDVRLRRLAASPVSRLAAGGMRRELARAVAAGGPLWHAMTDRDGATLEQALAAGVTRARTADAEAATTDGADVGAADRAERLRREKARSKRLLEERDAARRALEGAEARADAAEARAAGLVADLEAARAEVAQLRDELAEARAGQAAAVARERRRAAGERHELEEEVRRLRRSEERRRERARRAADPGRGRPPAAAAPAPAPPPTAGGRPTVLPRGVAPGTTAAAELLLRPPRRLVVDGYNVTRTHRPDLDLERQRDWLVGVVAGLAARRRLDDPLVVFDGAGGAASTTRVRGVRVRFSPAELSADDDIVFDVAAADPALPITVVTDDRELAGRVAEYDVDVLGTQPFLWAAT